MIRLEGIDGIKDDLKDRKAQAKEEGFNVSALVRPVAIRRNKGRVDQENELLNDLLLYAHATGTPLDIAFVDDSAAANSTKTSPLDPATAPAEEIHRPASDRPT